jgi:hypothetical protein
MVLLDKKGDVGINKKTTEQTVPLESLEIPVVPVLTLAKWCCWRRTKPNGIDGATGTTGDKKRRYWNKWY